MAHGLSTASEPILAPEDGLYRFVHPANSNPDGSLNSGAFSLRRDTEMSLGMERLIPQNRFEAFCAIKPGQGVARISIGDVTQLEMRVVPTRDSEWGEFADAHSILVGYSGWSNRKKDEVARRLRDIANGQILRKPNRCDT